MSQLPIFIGWDAAQLRACNVAAHSARTRATVPIAVQRIAMAELVAKQLYRRPTRALDGGGYWDEISAAPMSTGHAIARFLVPQLCNHAGWALFVDGDVLFRDDVARLFALADPTKALQVVQHQYDPRETVKMTGLAQTTYARKNWSSVILWNCAHRAHRALTAELVNGVPGRDLHRFCWLDDALIGALPTRWNALVGSAMVVDPAIVHFTEGLPDMAGYEQVAYADEWRVVARACGYRLTEHAAC